MGGDHQPRRQEDRVGNGPDQHAAFKAIVIGPLGMALPLAMSWPDFDPSEQAGCPARLAVPLNG